MKTTFDVQNILYKVLSGSPELTSVLSGGIYKKRPVNSDKEDIVIGTLPINNDPLQRTIANVNIHVPNKSILINGIEDISQPDSAKLNMLTKIVLLLLDDKWPGGYWFFIQQQNIFEEGNEHYVNIRVEFYNENIQ